MNRPFTSVTRLARRDAAPSPPFTFAATIVAQTAKAYRLDFGTGIDWFAKKHTFSHPNGTFTVPGWVAIQKGVQR